MAYSISGVGLPSSCGRRKNMSKKSRDFYHIQDQLPLAWRYSSGPRRVDDRQLEVLSQQIDDLGQKLIKSNPELTEFIDLSSKRCQCGNCELNFLLACKYYLQSERSANAESSFTELDCVLNYKSVLA